MEYQLDTSHLLVAVDWGTTNRRLFVIDAAGTCLSETTDACGVATLGKEGVAQEVLALRQRFVGHRLILAGMVGSSIGWREVPYMACPAGIGCLVQGAQSAELPETYLLPGVCSAPEDVPDVMRGEEVQLIGAAEAGLIPPDASVCHPGTHAKWAQMKSYAIHAFRTVMTGEIFGLLRSGSILSAALQAPVTVGEAFDGGVATGLASHALAADLFSIRARLLLGRLAPEEAASWASGVLIGSDIAFGLGVIGTSAPVAIIGDGQLTALYAAGLRVAGQESYEVDGAKAFVAGCHAIARRLPCPT